MRDENDLYWDSFLQLFFDRMNASIRAHMADEVKSHGLTSAHAVYLVALVLNGDMSQTELSRFLDLDPSNTNRVMKVLREKGMVYDDRISPESRNYKIHLTEEGRSLGSRVLDSTRIWMDSIMSDIPPDDVRTMRRTLLRLMDNMESDLRMPAASSGYRPFYSYLSDYSE